MTTNAMPDADIVAAAQELRHDLHAHPELAFEEHRTAALVAARLRAAGIEVAEQIGRRGVVGVLRNGEGPAIALRADMDALPIQEVRELPYRSRQAGVMHACGHDGHTAMLLGAAEQLARGRDFAGTVVFVFQPAEENEAGAKAMLADGLTRRFPFHAIYGLHNLPGLPVGIFAARKGAFLASFDKFTIEVSGSGGHSSEPHKASDALRAGMAIGLALPDLARTHAGPTAPAVVSVTALKAGEGFNVIPAHCAMRGSFRTLDRGAHDRIAAAIAPLAEAIARLHNCTAATAIDADKAYPVLVNSERETEAALDAATAVVGSQRVMRDVGPVLGAEDFAFYLAERPGNLIGMGNGSEAGALHTPDYDFNDAALPYGIAYWTSLVRNQLARGQ